MRNDYKISFKEYRFDGNKYSEKKRSKIFLSDSEIKKYKNALVGIIDVQNQDNILDVTIDSAKAEIPRVKNQRAYLLLMM